MGVFRERLGRLSHAWNVFLNESTDDHLRVFDYGSGSSSRPDRPRVYQSSERSILASIQTRISIDAADVAMRHVRVDKNDRYTEDIDSQLNRCLTIEANLDQKARHFRQDIVHKLLSLGTVAAVPVVTTLSPQQTTGFDVKNMRCGAITEWLPAHVIVDLYNERTGRHEHVRVGKEYAAVVENPLYEVMNQSNSTLSRLTRKLYLLDVVDEQLSSGKLDIIIQLPYQVASDKRQQQANQRRKDIEFQLTGSKYGIAYIDGTEKITQLNRPAENNLLNQVEMLFNKLYTELGITPEVMNGTADEATMLNYHSRTIIPILDAITESMTCAFISKTGQTQGQRIRYFRNPFKYVPTKDLAELVDKFTRNEVMSSNEWRQILGLKPDKDPKADELRNSNMPESELGRREAGESPPKPAEDDEKPDTTSGEQES